jgi:hypothetical protein
MLAFKRDRKNRKKGCASNLILKVLKRKPQDERVRPIRREVNPGI